MMSGRGRYWVRMLMANVAAAIAVMLVYSGVGLGTPWRSVVRSFAVAFTFAGCIGFPASFIMPRVAARTYDRLSRPRYWALSVAVLLAVGVAGSVLAILVLVGVGHIPIHSFGEWFFGSLKITVVMTLVFGIFATAYETMRTRLDDARVALRTKERDEADARRIAAQAQLASLESRVNPHFLFNTLNSIATLVHDNPSAAERMTTQLAALLRSSLDADSALVPLADELNVVRAYLEIERVRFGDRLRYDVQAEGDVALSRVPRLAVQTLVENSVKFAVSPRREGASVAVRAAAANGHLRIEVVDDGPGFDGTIVPGHGLALVRARLAAAFGDRASLRIDGAPGRTRVAIELQADDPRTLG